MRMTRRATLQRSPVQPGGLAQRNRRLEAELGKRSAADLQALLDDYKKALKETETSNDPSKAAIKEMLERMIDQLTVLIQKEETKDSINSDVE